MRSLFLENTPYSYIGKRQITLLKLIIQTSSVPQHVEMAKKALEYFSNEIAKHDQTAANAKLVQNRKYISSLDYQNNFTEEMMFSPYGAKGDPSKYDRHMRGTEINTQTNTHTKNSTVCSPTKLSKGRNSLKSEVKTADEFIKEEEEKDKVQWKVQSFAMRRTNPDHEIRIQQARAKRLFANHQYMGPPPKNARVKFITEDNQRSSSTINTRRASILKQNG